MELKKRFYSIRQIKQPYIMLVLVMFLFFWMGCSSEEEVVIPTPEISGLENSYILLEGDVLELTPIITNDNNAQYQWILDGEEVASKATYTFTSSQPGSYDLILIVSNQGGTSQKKMSIDRKSVV